LKRKAMFYLAAAVSDFFLPKQKMSEHKIQSGKGNLSIEMDQVPKILKPMVDEWTKGGYIVSFKLETDPALLLPKARQALERYGHQVVIGNDLNRRKFEVVFVSKETLPPPRADEIQQSTANLSESFVEYWLRIDIPDANPGVHVKEIEEDIVSELLTRHAEWIKNTQS